MCKNFWRLIIAPTIKSVGADIIRPDTEKTNLFHFQKMNHPRKNLRLKDYNYSANGGYFITICTKNRENYFGEIKDDKMFLSEYGHLVKKYWEEIPEHFDDVILDMFVIMPNHIHWIVFLENEICGGDVLGKPEISGIRGEIEFSRDVGNANLRSLHPRTKEKIPLVIQNFKASVTRNGKIFFPTLKFAWKKSFHDRIIRNENELEHFREYIVNNPINWAMDAENISKF